MNWRIVPDNPQFAGPISQQRLQEADDRGALHGVRRPTEIGASYQAASFDKITAITAALEANFTISPWLLLPALLVIVLAVKRMPPIPSLFAGVLAGAVTAMLAQGVGVHDLLPYANSGYGIDTGIDSLLNRGGIQSMMWTISLILIALGFGGALEKTGYLEAIIRAIMTKVRSFAACRPRRC
ncbi:Na+/H+ antiporter NhaC family protein [Halomonas stenophila]|uniref:Na+/H+ antiporter NhaC n=1 Tax=Halomonas stenophila TaxID=795312 RepID=A0A7W5HN27_9GAMM|nr:Na+/H+ antiporter NhaC [Halomonas stenophila]